MRAIDADAFKEYIRGACEDMKHLFKDNADFAKLITESFCKDIDEQPTIQPEIVRCKDCKYAEYLDDVQALWCTECGQGRTVAPNDFCSYAERRE